MGLTIRHDKEVDLAKGDAACQGVLQKNQAPVPLPLPRKRRFETGGGKYRSYWLSADYSKERNGVTMFAYEFAKALNRPGIPQGFITMSSRTRGA